MAYRPEWIIEAERQMALTRACLERVYEQLDELKEKLAESRDDLAATTRMLSRRDEFGPGDDHQRSLDDDSSAGDGPRHEAPSAEAVAEDD